ncbi:hypothetical protein ACFQW6_18515 [Nocardioides sp. GCM10028917]|uniref:hypothetical protein n=1 Tax=Nocardioides sp. GCM10028917 TaxID=3273408 RepID=UPI00361267A7
MRRTSLSIAAGITAVLLVSGTPAAQAAVSAKDLPKKGDIVTAFPEMADAEFTSFTSKQSSVPGATCDTAEIVKVKRLASIRGVSSAGASYVQSTVVQHSSAAKVKTYLKSYKKYAEDCATFTEPTSGGTVTTTLVKAPRLGQSTVMLQQETAVAGVVSYSSTVFIGDGKRAAAVVAIDDAAIPASAIKKLAKVAAKKMK